MVFETEQIRTHRVLRPVGRCIPGPFTCTFYYGGQRVEGLCETTDA